MNTLQAIVTKFHGPTDTLPGRIIAKAAAGRVTHYYDHGLSQEANHDFACRMLATKLDWKAVWFRGGMPGGSDVVAWSQNAKASRMGWGYHRTLRDYALGQT